MKISTQALASPLSQRIRQQILKSEEVTPAPTVDKKKVCGSTEGSSSSLTSARRRQRWEKNRVGPCRPTESPSVLEDPSAPHSCPSLPILGESSWLETPSGFSLVKRKNSESVKRSNKPLVTDSPCSESSGWVTPATRISVAVDNKRSFEDVNHVSLKQGPETFVNHLSAESGRSTAHTDATRVSELKWNACKTLDENGQQNHTSSPSAKWMKPARHPKSWDPEELLQWLSEKRLNSAGPNEKVLPRVDGRAIMRMTTPQLAMTFYRQYHPSDASQAQEQARLLYRMLRVQADLAARSEFKRQLQVTRKSAAR